MFHAQRFTPTNQSSANEKESHGFHSHLTNYPLLWSPENGLNACQNIQ
jgi:hypothetical protein